MDFIEKNNLINKLSKHKSIAINEIFYSIQGEGKNSGKPSIFIRFFGCNLKCDFCDSMKAVIGNDFKLMKHNAILSQIELYNCKHIVLTGGEPLLHLKNKEFKDFLRILKILKYTIEVETNGTQPISYNRSYFDIVNVSYKLFLNEDEYPFFLQIRGGENVFYKFVITEPKEDLKKIKKIIEKYDLNKDCIYLMPEGITKDSIIKNGKKVIELCLKEGFHFSSRNQVFFNIS